MVVAAGRVTKAKRVAQVGMVCQDPCMSVSRRYSVVGHTTGAIGVGPYKGIGVNLGFADSKFFFFLPYSVGVW